MVNIPENRGPLSAEHIGRRIIYSFGRQLREGVVEEISPSGGAFCVDGRWLPNQPEVLVEFLPVKPPSGPQRVSPARIAGRAV